jgi:hypothetical protein
MTETLESELERLRDYLRDFATCHLNWSQERGYPRSVPYLAQMRPGVADSSELREGPDPFVMGVIDSCIQDLRKRIPEALPVLLVRYLNKDGPSVYRHGRLQNLTPEETDAIADRAELELVPMVKRKGVIL